MALAIEIDAEPLVFGKKRLYRFPGAWTMIRKARMTIDIRIFDHDIRPRGHQPGI